MQVWIDVPDDLLVEVERRLSENKRKRLMLPKITDAQRNEAMKIANERGTAAANEYLRSLQRRLPALSRSALLARLLVIGFAHIAEVDAQIAAAEREYGYLPEPAPQDPPKKASRA